jgi:hypothetical protein
VKNGMTRIIKYVFFSDIAVEPICFPYPREKVFAIARKIERTVIIYPRKFHLSNAGN